MAEWLAGWSKNVLMIDTRLGCFAKFRTKPAPQRRGPVVCRQKTGQVCTSEGQARASLEHSTHDWVIPPNSGPDYSIEARIYVHTCEYLRQLCAPQFKRADDMTVGR